AIGVFVMVAIGGAFEGVSIGVGAGNVKVDSPYTITVLSLVLSLFATMNVAAIAGNAACRDVEEGMHPLVYTTPVPKLAFLGARWLASLVTTGWIVSAIPVGLLLGAKLPVLEPERVGSWSVATAAVALLGWVLPNLVFTSALFFGLAALTRRMFPNYIGGILLLVGYLGSSALTADLDNETVAAMIDPFGLGAFEHQTDYWSPHERNTTMPWPSGVSIANRALWMAVGLGFLAGGIGLARLDQDGRSLPFRRRKAAPVEAAVEERAIDVPSVVRRFDRPTRLAQGWALTRRALRDVIGHRYFWAFVGAAVLFQLLNAQVIGTLYGTDTWPVTYQVIEVLEGTLQLFLLVVLTFYAGDLVWHERDLGSAALYDSLPVPDALPMVAKAVALFAVIAGMHVTVLVMGVGIQLVEGYTHLELGLYAQWLFGLSLLDWLPYVALALAVHTVVNHKIVGHLVLVAFWVGQGFRGAMGFEYNLPWFGSDPGRTWSDMNGWGWFLGPYLVYKAYWIAVAVVIAGLARLWWVRGTDVGRRWPEARRRLDRGTVTTLAVGATAAAALAGLIVLNTNVRRDYRSSVDQRRQQVDYETRYKPVWDGAPHPRITDVTLTVDLYPKTGVVHAAGTMGLENRTGAAIARILLSVPQTAELASLTLDRPFTESDVDAELGLRVWTLATPLEPGEQAILSFDLTVPDRGFPNRGANTSVVPNGSFVHSGEVIPGLGYERQGELSAKAERRKYDLPERPRMLDLDDPVARTRNYLTDDADRVQLDVTVTTDRGQTALAPGALIGHGEDGDRAWYHYRTVRPILHFYSFLSGAWEIQRDRWGDVAIEVYYDPAHHYNVDRMIASVQASLASFSSAFGPYQYGEVRIVEFPRYEQYAQSFPSTIPFSEAIGFVARLDDPDEDVDFPYYVTAHEVAHQWWAHQVIGADAQGSTVLSETLAQYSALKVMAEAYGDDQIHKFLRYEADRYFNARAVETDKEVPLLRVEDQGYIHYNKGGIAMWALRAQVGEDRLDAAIRTFLDRWRDQGPPYPTARDLYDVLRTELPDASTTLRDLFEAIVLYENRPTAATATRNPDGTYTVHLTLALAKTEADAVGEETEVPFAESVEVGVFAGTEDHREPLVVERRTLTGPTAELELVVPRAPTLAGVDPNHLLLDRDRDDNLMPVRVED
ncbi:MAG: M1 family aminopeptidase, partial [Myxococcota bacterium]